MGRVNLLYTRPINSLITSLPVSVVGVPTNKLIIIGRAVPLFPLLVSPPTTQYNSGDKFIFRIQDYSQFPYMNLNSVPVVGVPTIAVNLICNILIFNGIYGRENAARRESNWFFPYLYSLKFLIKKAVVC
jgi:hypothetical protein